MDSNRIDNQVSGWRCQLHDNQRYQSGEEAKEKKEEEEDEEQEENHVTKERLRVGCQSIHKVQSISQWPESTSHDGRDVMATHIFYSTADGRNLKWKVIVSHEGNFFRFLFDITSVIILTEEVSPMVTCARQRSSNTTSVKDSCQKRKTKKKTSTKNGEDLLEWWNQKVFSVSSLPVVFGGFLYRTQLTWAVRYFFPYLKFLVL